MRNLTTIACLALATVGCFEDLGPTGDDDVGDSGESTTEGSTSDDGESESESESESADSVESETFADSVVTLDEAETLDAVDEFTDTGTVEGDYQPCGPGQECPDGGQCVISPQGEFEFGICLPQGCVDAIQCPAPPDPSELSCNLEGLCELGCQNAGMCAGGMACLGELCFFNVTFGPCANDMNCPMNHKCSGDAGAGTCTPPCNGDDSECFGTSPNPDNTIACDIDRCEIVCTGDSDCPAPMFCDDLISRCRYPS